VPRVIPITEKAIIVLRSPCTWMVKPEGGHIGEEEFQRVG